MVDTEGRAREVTAYRARQKREMLVARTAGLRGSLEQMMTQLKTAGRKEFPLVIKGDVQGSVEAVVGALDKLGTEEVAARIIHSGVGGINESDVTLAEAAGAAIIGFNVRAHKEAREAAEHAGIEIRYPLDHFWSRNPRLREAILLDERTQSRREIVGVREQTVLHQPADPTRVVIAGLSVIPTMQRLRRDRSVSPGERLRTLGRRAVE